MQCASWIYKPLQLTVMPCSIATPHYILLTHFVDKCRSTIIVSMQFTCRNVSMLVSLYFNYFKISNFLKKTFLLWIKAEWDEWNAEQFPHHGYFDVYIMVCRWTRCQLYFPFNWNTKRFTEFVIVIVFTIKTSWFCIYLLK